MVSRKKASTLSTKSQSSLQSKSETVLDLICLKLWSCWQELKIKWLTLRHPYRASFRQSLPSVIATKQVSGSKTTSKSSTQGRGSRLPKDSSRKAGSQRNTLKKAK